VIISVLMPGPVLNRKATAPGEDRAPADSNSLPGHAAVKAPSDSRLVQQGVRSSSRGAGLPVRHRHQVHRTGLLLGLLALNAAFLKAAQVDDGALADRRGDGLVAGEAAAPGPLMVVGQESLDVLAGQLGQAADVWAAARYSQNTIRLPGRRPTVLERSVAAAVVR